MLLNVREVADFLGLSENWVRANAGELGGFKVGPGRSAPYRFESSAVFNWKQARHAQLVETRA